MNNTAQSGAKTGYLVIMLLVVGLAAFSSAMKELSQLHQFVSDASSLVAQWSNPVAPTEIPMTVAKLESCESNRTLKQSVPTVELPWLATVVEEKKIEVKTIEPPLGAERTRRSRVQIVRPNTFPGVDFDPVELEVRVSTDHDAEPDVTVPSDLPQFSFKTKTRKHNIIRISPRDREMILKTLNRSINLRIAS